MATWRSLIFLVLFFVPATAFASAGDDANEVVNRWATAFNANDAEGILRFYAPDAIVLGTASPIIADQPELIRDYFKSLPGSGNKVAIGDHRIVVLSNEAVLVTGFYEFTPMREGKPVPVPARFTMVVVKRGPDWLILHHHSSRRPEPAK
jgi:uncharacterized protein (TIGR02246 family)